MALDEHSSRGSCAVFEDEQPPLLAWNRHHRQR